MYPTILPFPLVHLLSSSVSPLLLLVLSQSFRTRREHQEPVALPAPVTQASDQH